MFCDHCEVASVFSQQVDQGGNLILWPVGIVFFDFNYVFLFLFGQFILESDLVDEGGDGGDWWLSTGILMTVHGINSHAEDITDSI